MHVVAHTAVAVPLVLVRVAREDVGAVRAERSVLAAGAEIPEPDGPVGARGDEPSPVGAEGDGVDRAAVPRQLTLRVAGAAPEADRAVEAARRDLPAAGMIGAIDATA